MVFNHYKEGNHVIFNNTDKLQGYYTMVECYIVPEVQDRRAREGGDTTKCQRAGNMRGAVWWVQRGHSQSFMNRKSLGYDACRASNYSSPVYYQLKADLTCQVLGRNYKRVQQIASQPTQQVAELRCQLLLTMLYLLFLGKQCTSKKRKLRIPHSSTEENKV